ncbi:hypothetical protein HU200_012273 [Digitaria exilis]|uniref:Helicase ATP-binding domain-containing protein n=1 Tax=Digitaria exilis TaxID=1010633 RepID=A0A835KM01_9POAL|nr:hypothetical protein HU200_012273 [Digitaria exilis]
MGTLSSPSVNSILTKDWGVSPAAQPIKQEEVSPGVFVDASLALPVQSEANSGDALPVAKAMNGDASLMEVMKKEEEQLKEAWLKSEEAREARKREEAARVDEMLTKMQLFSEFLLENMDQITYWCCLDVKQEGQAEDSQVEEKGRGRKRKAKPQYDDKKAKTAVAAMLTRSRDDRLAEDCTVSEERWEEEQANLVPLLTGGKLKSYQIKGVKWLISLWQNGLNGILADQMGLGKTIQPIGFLAHLKGKGLHGPYLIIAPLSNLSNWVNDISRFTPFLASIIYHGDKVARAEIRRKFLPKTVGPDFPIVVTSYEMAMEDVEFLAVRTWKYIIVDEGHRLKSLKCKLLREMKHIPMENKLLLTGTPLQNNRAELWSLLNFILPGIFLSYQEFESWIDFSGEGNEEQEETEEKRRVHVVSKIHSILRPYVLRQMKEDVEQMLPRKKERTIYASMTEHQKQIQDHLVHKTFDKVLSQNNSNSTILKNGGSSLKSHLHCEESLREEGAAVEQGSTILPEQVKELKKEVEELKKEHMKMKKQLEEVLKMRKFSI